MEEKLKKGGEGGGGGGGTGTVKIEAQLSTARLWYIYVLLVKVIKTVNFLNKALAVMTDVQYSRFLLRMS